MVAKNLWHYFSLYTIILHTSHPLKSVIKKPNIVGMLAHIIIELREYDIKFMPRSFVKAQALADFVAKFGDSLEVVDNEDTVEVCNMEIKKA